MFNSAFIASAALMVTAALADTVGTARVINMCDYPVYLCNVPSADGGYSEIKQTLNSNDQYEQQYTELSNGNGWSIKLGKTEDATNIMQYEYTFHNDDIIWYDLSDVNGNPWDQNWEITATCESGECNPKQQAYRYATDDAYGMQACPQDSVITVTLCSGEDSDDSGAASASSSAAEQTSAAATQTSSFSTPSQSAPTEYTWVASASSTVEASSTAAASSTADASPSTTVQQTTFATSTTVAVTSAHAGVTVTEVQTAVVTDVVTATHWHHGGKRHEHHRRHGARA